MTVSTLNAEENLNFFHIAQSSYSFLESILKPKDIVACAKKHGMHSVCMADDSNMFGCLEFNLAAVKAKIKPISGVKLCMLHNGRLHYLTLLIQNAEGYQNAMRLTSYVYIRNAAQPVLHITLDQLLENHEGLIVISRYSNGLLYLDAKNVLQTDIVRELSASLKGRIYLEIMRTGTEEEKVYEDQYLNVASELEMPILATNTVLFPDINTFEVHDILLCISDRRRKSETDRRCSNNQHYFKSFDEMRELFSDIPEAIENNIGLSQRCNFILKEMPPILPPFGNKETSEEAILRSMAHSGLHQRLVAKASDSSQLEDNVETISTKYKEYFDRLDYELGVICNMNFAGYFLIVADFVGWSKANGVSVGPGRGSGAGAIVAWALKITELDPLEYGLIFERFLNPERVSMPDFDIDFCQKNRFKVIDYVVNKYGQSRVAQIITFGTLQAKAVIKDVGRAMNLPFRYANKLTELIPFNAVAPVTLEQAVQEVAELNQAYKGLGLYTNDSSFESDKGEGDNEMNALMKEVLEYSLMLEGLHRHASVHAAGVVISGADLVERVALYKEEDEEMYIIQASMKYAEALGLVKFDFLGLQTLTLISACCDLIKQERGIEININDIPLDDANTYTMLSRADALGVFQLEGGMVRVLKDVRPDSVQDIMALTALYRPGPMDNIHVYIKCKHGEQQPVYLHEKMEPVLRETYGVIVYQEQVIELAKVLGGYSLSGADNLRRAMGKKNKQEMDMHRSTFVEGCGKNGIGAKLAEEIFDSIEKFAGYGFNKAHAAAYAMISYQSAYLKANFKPEFIVSFLNLELSDHVKLEGLINYAKKSNIKIMPPCINSSEPMFTIKHLNDATNTMPNLSQHSKQPDQVISYGLNAIKSLGHKVAEDIMQARGERSFADIFDFLHRISSIKNFNKKALEGLIKSGALDVFDYSRNMLYQNINNMMEYMDTYRKDQMHQQLSLFADTATSFEGILEYYSEWDEITKLLYEFDFVGAFITQHPIEVYRKNFGIHNINQFNCLSRLSLGGHKIVLAGFIAAKYAKKSPRGKYINLKVSDETDIFEVTIFDEKVLELSAEFLNEKSLVIFECEVFITSGSYKLTAKSVIDLDSYCTRIGKHIELKLSSREEVNKIIKYLEPLAVSDGTHSLAIYAQYNGFYFRVNLNTKFHLSSSNIVYLKQYATQKPDDILLSLNA